MARYTRKNAVIKKVAAWQVFDSRGNPTLEAEVTLGGGLTGSAMAPSGASKGKYEALELRDQRAGRYLGRSVFEAVERVNTEIHRVWAGRNVLDQAALDELLIGLDGTEDKRRLGANAMVGASMAAARAAANLLGTPLHAYLGGNGGTLLPLPEIQIFGGGAHTAGRIDAQDFMIVCVGAESYEQCLEMTFNVYHTAGRILRQSGRFYGVADEGGYWPAFESHEQLFEVLLRAIEQAGYRPGKEIALSLDMAASELFDKGRYHFKLESQEFSSEQFSRLLAGWCRKHPIVSIEDPFAQEDYGAWARFTRKMGGRLQIVGDDLFATNMKRLEQGVREEWANSILIKPNQIGTVTETLRCIQAAQKAGWLPVISARSGETEDTFVTHLAVATNAGQLKVGAFARGERMAKWNELLRIQRQLGGRARFLGGRIFPFLKRRRQILA